MLIRIVLFSVNYQWPDSRNLVTSLPPPRLLSASADPSWTECLLKYHVKRKILSTPNFPRPLLQPAESSPYTITDIPGKGLGVLASRAIQEGEMILDERPLMILPGAQLVSGKQVPYSEDPTISEEEKSRHTQLAVDQVIEIVYKRMSDANQRKFDALANAHTHDVAGRLWGIVRTNGWQTGFKDGELHIP